MEGVSGNLRAMRKARGLSIYDVERATGIRFTLISAYERGERKPSLKNARKLARFFNVPVAHFILAPEEVAECIPKELRYVASLLLSRPDLRELVEELSDVPPDAVKDLTDFIATIHTLPPR